MKTLPTAAPPLLVWVIKHEFTPHLTFLKLHLCPDQGHQGFAVDHYFNSLVLHHFVKFFDLVFTDVVHRVA